MVLLMIELVNIFHISFSWLKFVKKNLNHKVKQCYILFFT